MKLIPLSQGKFAKVDDEDYEWLSQWKWYYRHGYAVRQLSIGYKKQKAIRMHNEIIDNKENMEIDHINNDKLDNRKINLRLCTHMQNTHNRGKGCNNTSGYKGIDWSTGMRKWRARITSNNYRQSLGFFDTVEDAAHAYDEAAKKYHGEFAKLNFPEDK